MLEWMKRQAPALLTPTADGFSSYTSKNTPEHPVFRPIKPGFGNAFASEAVPNTLPLGQNAPQKGEQSRLRDPKMATDGLPGMVHHSSNL